MVIPSGPGAVTVLRGGPEALLDMGIGGRGGPFSERALTKTFNVIIY